MDTSMLLSKIPRKIFFFTLTLLLSIIGVVRYSVNLFDLSYVSNDKPFSIPLPFPLSILVLLIIIGFLFFSGLIKKFSFSTAFIIAGALGNFVERLFLSSVRDYINIYVGWINLSDLILWTGLIILNYEFWFKTIDSESEIEEEYEELDIKDPTDLRTQIRSKMDGIRSDLDEINTPPAPAFQPIQRPLAPAKITYVDHEAKIEAKKVLEKSLQRDSYLKEQQKYEEELIKNNFDKLAQEPPLQDPQEHMQELKSDLSQLRSKVQSIKVNPDPSEAPRIKIRINNQP
jgi:hypothetical protein